MQSDNFTRLRNGVLVSEIKTGVPIPSKQKFEEIDNTSPKGRMMELLPGQMVEFRVPEGIEIKALSQRFAADIASITLYRKGGERENHRLTMRRIDLHTIGVWCEDRPAKQYKPKKGNDDVGDVASSGK